MALSKPLRALKPVTGPNLHAQPSRAPRRAAVGPGAASSTAAESGGALDRNPRSRAPKYPQVLSQERSQNGTMLVTFALPNLRKAIIRVPFHSWLNGEHLAIGHRLATHHPGDAVQSDLTNARMTDIGADSVALDDYEPPS